MLRRTRRGRCNEGKGLQKTIHALTRRRSMKPRHSRRVHFANKSLVTAVRSGIAMAVLAGSPGALAQEAPPPVPDAGQAVALAAQEGATTLDTVSVLGSRSQPRSVSSSAVPIDILTAEEFRNQGSTDALDQLRVLVPSFNVRPIPLDAAASLIRPPPPPALPPPPPPLPLHPPPLHRSAPLP